MLPEGNTDTPEKAATLSIGKNAHINMSMGTGHVFRVVLPEKIVLT